MEKQLELMRRRLVRERLARKEAETIIEAKIRELYVKTQELECIAAAERRARMEAETLRSALEAFASGLELEEIVNLLESYIGHHVVIDGSTVYFYRDDNFRFYKSSGLLDGRCIDTELLLGYIEHAQGPWVLFETFDADDSALWVLGTRSRILVILPLAVQERLVGCLVLLCNEKNAIDENVWGLIQALANEAAITIENALLFQEIKRLSIIDPLTGLYNRRHFNSTATLEFDRARRYGLPLSAVLLDIDYFKHVNDTYGHSVGDEVLVKVAAACMHEMRKTDIHARYGGEEYCLLLLQTASDMALNLAERLRESVAQLVFEGGGGNFTVTASFGVSERLNDNDTLNNLLERCDKALYEAKKRGRNRVVAWPFGES
ncbi:MAG: diguanylate cyclase [Gammaproteobacteria bacterium]